MSYQDDLDWLARNVHEWPGGDHQPWCYVYFKCGERAVSGNCITVIEPCVRIEKCAWLARRAELQNKPSWPDAPGWAEWLAQSPNGHWEFFSVKPVAADWWTHPRDAESKANDASSPGIIIGDWRDTLEKRPDMHKNHEEIDTSAERVQKTPESIRNWHESGELPPVGAFVDVTGDVAYGEGEKGCEVIAHVEDCAVIRMSWGLGCFVSRALSPHRTERDELVNVITKAGVGSYAIIVAEAVLSAGFRRDGGKS